MPGTTWVFPGDASGDARAFAGAGGDEQGGSTGLEEGSLDMDAVRYDERGSASESNLAMLLR